MSPVFAEALPEHAVAGYWQLTAKPHICVTSEAQLPCVMNTEIIWTGSVKADICLLSSHTQARIQCWANKERGGLLQNIASDVSINYWIAPLEGDAILAETTIRIVTVPQRQIRRRRRHIWSLL